MQKKSKREFFNSFSKTIIDPMLYLFQYEESVFLFLTYKFLHKSIFFNILIMFFIYVSVGSEQLVNSGEINLFF